MAPPYVARADLETYLKRTLAASEYALADLSIEAACEIVRRYLRQDLNFRASDSVRIDGSGTTAIPLPELPVVDVIEVKVADSNDDFQLFDEWLLGHAGRLYRRDGEAWPLGVANVRVTYDHGYAETDAGVDEPAGIYRVPPDLLRVTLAIASDVFMKAGKRGDMRTETIGNYSYTVDGRGESSDLPAAYRRVLDPHRVHRRGRWVRVGAGS